MVILRRLLLTVVAAAVYGFSIGSLHSPWLARWNLLKFPVLILVTALVCSVAYHVTARFVTRQLSFAAMCDLAVATYADTSVLLASLAPVSFFLALTVEQPTQDDLNEYPLFLGLNVAFIAIAGALSLSRRALHLRRDHGLSTRHTAALLAAWLAISLFAGGQVCWYFRPYFGVRAIEEIRLFDGSRPDYRGATSFYEAVYDLVDPPPLAPDYWRRR